MGETGWADHVRGEGRSWAQQTLGVVGCRAGLLPLWGAFEL